MISWSSVNCTKSSPLLRSSVRKGHGVHFIRQTIVSAFWCRKWVSPHRKLLLFFPPNSLWACAQNGRKLHVPLSHSPKICVPYFLAVISCQVPVCLLWRQETQRRCLGDWGQGSQWHSLCSTLPGPCLGALPRASRQPCDKAWSSDTKESPPCSHPGYSNSRLLKPVLFP